MFCCMSNRIPHEPVVSRVSGCLYERSLIEKYIAEHGSCPVTGGPLQKGDLIAVRPTTVTPSSSGADTVPGILAKLHSQWDAVMLEQFSLRQQLAQAQQELAGALHQYEAACRVIATFVKDQERAGSPCSGIQTESHNSHNGGGSGGGDNRASLPESVLRDMSEHDALQRAKRKTRLPSPTLASVQDVRSLVDNGFTDMGVGVSDVTWALNSSVFIGLDDARVVHYDLVEGCVRGTGIGHERAVRHVIACNNGSGDLPRVVSASDDSTVRVWSSETEEGLICQGVIRQHSGGIVGMGDILPGHLLLSASAVGIGIADVKRVESLAYVTLEAEHLSKLTCLAVHPYGSLAALGMEGAGLCIWNTHQMCVDTTVSVQEKNDICSVAFNPDCFTLATGLCGGKTLLWDLRKMSGPLHEISSVGTKESTVCGDAHPVVAFDGYGKYLAVAEKDIRLFDWELSPQEAVSTFSSHRKPATGVCWGPNARSLVSCSIDGTVRLYGLT